MIIISGLALNAFIEASNSFNKDKVNIDSAQKLSTVLELIGNEVRQSGEQINDARFPVIEIEPNTDAGSMVGSSKITIRKSLSVALTLCGNVAPTPTTLIVTDDTRSENNCKVGTPSTTTLPTTISRPNVLRQARDKRCQVDDPNGNYNVANTDFCQGNSSEVVMAAMSDGLGNIRTFKYTGDTEVSATTYQIS
ncbi:hypothetical protein, partial [Chamaesiphon sp. VAR_48_metabat_403]|uniref:hypothetical protein n=1 Tax=Chamaesiphon sp. VAR_48_metabat_403 TaxID=2964700 RepID=UPI00286E885E